MREIIHNFFNKQYENTINHKTLYYDYVFPEIDVINYVKDVIAVPLSEYVAYVCNCLPNKLIVAADVFQFSKLNDATFGLCSIIKNINNPGVNYLQAGELLLDDGKTRLKGAYLKYGENHLKTGASIGFLFEITRTYFLSIYGSVIDLLSTEEQNLLLVRLIIRNNLISRLIKIGSMGRINVREFLYMLSDSTYKRRSSNIKSIIDILKISKEFNFDPILKNIIF